MCKVDESKLCKFSLVFKSTDAIGFSLVTLIVIAYISLFSHNYLCTSSHASGGLEKMDNEKEKVSPVK